MPLKLHIGRGGTLPALARTLTPSATLVLLPSPTLSWKANVVGSVMDDGTVKLGCAALVLDSVTAGPAVCCH